MKKSKHFRKDVILARIIAGAIFLILIILLVLGISLLTKSSGEGKNSQSSQNTQNTEDLVPGDQDTQEQGTEDAGQPSNSEDDNSEGEGSEPGQDENHDTIYVPDKVYVETTTQVRLRKEPNTSCATLDRIDGGTKLEVLETLEGWYKVSYNGQEGYVSATYTEIVEE